MRALAAAALVALSACSASPRALSPDAGSDAGDFDASSDACDDVTTSAAYAGGLAVDFAAAGARGVGAACAFGPACASGLCSASAATGACGVCLERRRLGETCGSPTQGCSASAICRDGTCQTTKKPLGASCALQPKGADLLECDDDLFCARQPDGAGTCVQRVALGVACAQGDVCVPGASCLGGVCALPGASSCAARDCGPGQFCVRTNDTATCQPGTLAPGAPCGIVDGNFVDNGCAATEVCGNLDFPNGGGGPSTVETCLPRPKEGDVCILYACAAGLFCGTQTVDCLGTLDRRCVKLGHDGEVCGSVSYGRDHDYFESSCAPPLECRAGHCRQPCQ